MNRRWGGVLLLVAVLLAAMVVPRLGGHRVPGAAQRIPLPPSPEIGACVSAFDQPIDTRESLQVGILTGEFGSCGGKITGELVALLPESASDFAVGMGSNGGSSAAERAMYLHLDCQSEANRYAGLELTQNGRWTVPGGSELDLPWSINLGITGFVLMPGEKERQAGADWLGCVLYNLSSPFYVGSAGRVFDGESVSTEVGICWAEPGISTEISSCGEKYRTQFLGSAMLLELSAPANEATVNESCSRFASLAMGVPDPTFGGQLDVTGKFDASSKDWAYCTVSSTSGRALNRSLLGIGEGPLPWAE